jgi:hypothetical protein
LVCPPNMLQNISKYRAKNIPVFANPSSKLSYLYQTEGLITITLIMTTATDTPNPRNNLL